VADLEWLTEQRDKDAFISVADYRRRVLGAEADSMTFADDFAVTLEISALQYFPYLITEARKAIADRELMPGRYIRVRKMKEQEEDNDILAVAAAMQIVGASYVETLDTKGTDGSNVHLGGPETITGYFGGVGQPNDHALRWLDEFLYYYANYGIKQVLNLNPGTVLLAYFLHKIGIDNEFKISVYMGNDNPYAALWTLIGARLFGRPDGTTSLIGFNWSNSVNNETMEITAEVRKALNLEDMVRFEHHIVETYKSIVIQPYNRRDELIELADHVANISAKHEGGDPEIEITREYPSDILDYFRDKSEVIESGVATFLERNYMDKHDALNRTAWALTENGLSFVAARNLHK
jgi:antitoxin component of MazEF toxin-antitoxin module